MRFIPILYSSPMVRALIEGRKTLTRRIIKPQPDPEVQPDIVPRLLGNEDDWGKWYWDTSEGERILRFCPYGERGDVLWVRETWQEYGGLFYYKADGTEINDGPLGCANKWRPSIFMPKEVCRLFLRVKSVMAERLHNISPHDACDEGVEYWNIDHEALAGGELQADFMNYTWTEKKEKDESYEDRYFPTFANPVDSFRTLWQSINGNESWDFNPWVWRIEFKKINRPDNFLNKIV